MSATHHFCEWEKTVPDGSHIPVSNFEFCVSKVAAGLQLGPKTQRALRAKTFESIACCLGRICNKRLNKQKVSNDKPSSLRLSQHTPSFGPRERGRDLEIGFDKGFTAARHGNGSDPRGHKPFGKGHFSGHNARGEANPSAGDQGAPSAGP
ncbi:hypothetical protein DKX38_015080 [Salix brachista]|uniref:Uncharacterized protein n=1 Tax=Salix brachista TaxID=2182728 RepID=A0A5N5L477_9ROSI|nr:hypothetical protein DKX38_015080 [Salix brachista]